MSKNIDYEFKCLNEEDFECSFEVLSKARTFDYLYKKARKKAMKKTGLDIPENPNIDRFEVPSDFKRLLSTIFRGQFAALSRLVAKDGIRVVNANLNTAWFEKTNNGYLATIKYVGKYVTN